MDKIVIRGGTPLSGTVHVSGSKNAALPIITAALLTDGWNTFHNIPDLVDIESIKNLLRTLGVEVTGRDPVKINAGNCSCHEAPYDIVRKMRASILVLGPLLARWGRARVSLPGGCAIGARPVNLHLKALQALGARIELVDGYIDARVERLRGTTIFFDVSTVTGTENIMMAAALADGTTVLENAAREPEIVNLADVLNAMGARIQGAGTNVITIEGVRDLHAVEASVIPDRIEAGTYMIAAAITGGEVLLTGCNPPHLDALVTKLNETGITVDTYPDSARVRADGAVGSVDVTTLPYPGFPTDYQAQMMALMTIARGTSVISETVFENRFMHVNELMRLGADIVIEGNHAVVRGVPRLRGAPVMATDLRASASLIIAGLAAEGETIVSRVYHLDRGYERIEEKLSACGADIRRVPS